MRIIDITEFEGLIRNSKLSKQYKLYAMNYVACIINTNKGKNSDFVNNKGFLKTIKVILNCKQQDPEIYTLLTSYVESYIRLINNGKLGTLINNSKLGAAYKLFIIKDIANLINTNKGKSSGFINNEDFLKTFEIILNCNEKDSEIYKQLARYLRLINNNKYYRSLIIEDIAKDENKDIVFNFLKDENLFRATEVISNSSIQENMKYQSIISAILCLKDNNEQQKSGIILYALLSSHSVISTYAEQTIPRAPRIKRPNNKRSDVKMSDYLLDSQMIKEDISWLKKTNQRAFQELHDQIEKMQDPEIKETFNDYCNQINSHEKREALKYRALATICIVSAVAVIVTKSPLIAVIAAIVVSASTIVFGGYLLLNSKLESIQLHTIKNPPQHPIVITPTCIFTK